MEINWREVLIPYFKNYNNPNKENIINEIILQLNTSFPTIDPSGYQFIINDIIPELVNKYIGIKSQPNTIQYKNLKRINRPFKAQQLERDEIKNVSLDYCTQGDVVDSIKINEQFDYRIITGLWLYWSLKDESFKHYIEQNPELYNQIKRIFIRFNRFEKGSLLAISEDRVIVIVKHDEDYSFFEYPSSELIPRFKNSSQNIVLINCTM